MPIDATKLRQRWPLPSTPRPIVIIGTGGIVNDAHLPAYALAEFPVVGLYDVDPARSRQTAERFGVSTVFETLREAIAHEGVVFDVAVPPEHLLSILEALPPKSAVLMQKPMGRSLKEAQSIVHLCRERQLTAAVNFQLRYSPMMLALRELLDTGALGTIVDVDIHLNYREPWEQFPFLKGQPRVEMLIASIHYFDWVRSVLGEPNSVYAKSISHPLLPEFEATRTSAILDYGETTRCSLSLNNAWRHGPRHEQCTLRVEGLDGAAVITLGCLVGYPNGLPDEMEYVRRGGSWTKVPLIGNWFPHAFLGTMSNLQRFVSQEDAQLGTRVEDALKTMALVEALYESSDRGGIPI